ncbi:MAG: hypothetical protein HOP36_08645 [Methyloglobulus sp.]|nr:hypothetical protein [Methyloglobulus sp.]
MLEKVWYEVSPIAYSILSIFVLLYSNILGVVFAFILLSVSVFIGVMRFQYRSKPKLMVKGSRSASTNRRS